jgi:hypothetical protein
MGLVSVRILTGAFRHARRALLDRLNGASSVEEALGETIEQFEAAEAEEGLDREDPDEFSEPHDLHEPEFRPPEPMGPCARSPSRAGAP